MPVDHKEKAFETAIEHHLITSAGYAKAEQGTSTNSGPSTRRSSFLSSRHTAKDTGETGETARNQTEDDRAGRTLQGHGLARQPRRDPPRLQVLRRADQSRVLPASPQHESR